MTTPTVLKLFNLGLLTRNTRGVLLLIPWLVHLFASDIILSGLFPFHFLFPTAVYNLSSSIASLVWRGIQTIFASCNRAQITVSGDELPQNESAVVIANHLSWTDFYLIQHLAIKCGMLGRCRYFVKRQLRWVPFLGWGFWAMGMPMISRNWDKDRVALDRVFRGPKTYGWPIWLISYSEATRFTAQKYLETVQWCKANNKPIPKFTLYPRTRGFVATVKELRKGSSIRAIYDVSLAYAHGKHFLEAPSMWESLSMPHLDRHWRFHVHVNRYSIEDLQGMSDSELVSWLEQRWIQKGKRLEELQKALEDGRRW